MKPNHAIMSLGYSEARSVIRISMPPGTTKTKIAKLIAALKMVLKR